VNTKTIGRLLVVVREGRDRGDAAAALHRKTALGPGARRKPRSLHDARHTESKTIIPERVVPVDYPAVSDGDLPLLTKCRGEVGCFPTRYNISSDRSNAGL
jgi:hypothetical protein